jgi:uncharacterized oligopeptide transporter (OPT) family protein
MGLAFVLPYYTSLSMFLGSFIFWLAGRTIDKSSPWHKRIVLNSETICAGIIAGGALMGILLALIQAAMKSPAAH